MGVQQVFVEKKKEFAVEADALLRELRDFLNIKGITGLRIINRYETDLTDDDVFQKCIDDIFSEKQVDITWREFPVDIQGGCAVLGVETLPGQFDQRADSASQCIQMAFQIERPTVKTARFYIFEGRINQDEMNRIERHLVNPVEARKASLQKSLSLHETAETPPSTMILNGFRLLSEAGVLQLCKPHNLAMSRDDILFIREYFQMEGRDPTNVELKILDTYWSDHCRHTTFNTVLDRITIADDRIQKAFDRYLNIRAELKRTKTAVTLMDIATSGARYLKKKGLLNNLVESEEINACTIQIDALVKKTGSRVWEKEPWYLLFKNETHNHPTEIEPFGGAATCIGGAIRDPLSGRAYVYQAMRISGGGNPLTAIEKTLPGKLPQRKLAVSSAHGYSSYGNQIGLATGLVREYYHNGYAAKHLELGAVLGAAPCTNVVRKKPKPGDVVILLGGRTGRDGLGGATGSSRAHNTASVEQCGAEVQKGNAPEERKLQRLFRNKKAARLIKKCNDFGAGGAAVAIGELARGLEIDLSGMPKKYAGLSALETAISESQERMAVLIAEKDVRLFLRLAAAENLEAAVVAKVTDEDRLVMKYNGETVADLARDFLDSNGAERTTTVYVPRIDTPPSPPLVPGAQKKTAQSAAQKKFEALVSDMNIASQKGLSERFDSTIGAGSVLAPWGGRYQATPAEVMCALLPAAEGETKTATLFAAGFNPFLLELDPYRGAYDAVVESVSKIVAAGGRRADCRLSFQEYFEKLIPQDGGDTNEAVAERAKWGKPFAALLGALDAQLDLGVAAIGGKDSMSGSYTYEDTDGNKKTLSVPPTLVSFAAAAVDAGRVISAEFKAIGSAVILVDMAACETLINQKKIRAAFALGGGGRRSDIQNDPGKPDRLCI